MSNSPIVRETLSGLATRPSALNTIVEGHAISDATVTSPEVAETEPPAGTLVL